MVIIFQKSAWKLWLLSDVKICYTSWPSLIPAILNFRTDLLCYEAFVFERFDGIRWNENKKKILSSKFTLYYHY